MNSPRTLLATAALLGFAGLAQAQQPFTVTGQSENFSVRYAESYRGNILGGGFAEFERLGQDTTIRYADPRVGQQAAGLPVDLGGRNGDVVYLPLPPRSSTLAAR